MASAPPSGMSATAAVKERPTHASYPRSSECYHPGPSWEDVGRGDVLARGHSGEGGGHFQGSPNPPGPNPPLAEDGLFGPKTEAALKSFQSQSGVDPTGRFGIDTLNATTAEGADPKAR